MSTSLFQFLRHLDVVVQVIFFSAFIQNISRVTDARFCDLALVEGFIQRHFHTLDPVKGIEDTEHVDS